MPTIEINGLRIHYLGSTGDQGRTKGHLIFVHGGGGGQARHWGLQIKRYRGPWPAVAVDLPGHGRSEGDSESTIDGYAEFLYRFQRDLGVERPVVAGHSMGGAIVLSFALRHPDLLRGMILVSTGPSFPRDPVGRPEFDDERGFRRWMAEVSRRSFGVKVPVGVLREIAGSTRALTIDTVRNDRMASAAFDFREKLSVITTPALVVSGRNDLLLPPEGSRALCEGLPNACSVEFPEVGHMPMVERPEAFNSALDAFLEGL